jgi:hypothetical protein
MTPRDGLFQDGCDETRLLIQIASADAVETGLIAVSKAPADIHVVSMERERF